MEVAYKTYIQYEVLGTGTRQLKCETILWNTFAQKKENWIGNGVMFKE